MKRIAVLIFLLVTFYLNVQAQTDSSFAAEVDNGLAKLIELKEKIKDIHPLLNKLYPVAVVNEDELYIFDYDSASAKYKFIKSDPVPFPMPEGIKASFPLSSYDWKPTCVVGLEAINSLSGNAYIFHEFVHCSQYSGTEPGIKNTLKINNEAMKKKDYSWELNYAFPYEDSFFVSNYESFLNALQKQTVETAEELRTKLKDHLGEINYEYLVWEEWKEGFARYIENKIRVKLGLEVNNGGHEKPYNRVTFYYGGAVFIDHLIERDKSLSADLEKLFLAMKEF